MAVYFFWRSPEGKWSEWPRGPQWEKRRLVAAADGTRRLPADPGTAPGLCLLPLGSTEQGHWTVHLLFSPVEFLCAWKIQLLPIHVLLAPKFLPEWVRLTHSCSRPGKYRWDRHSLCFVGWTTGHRDMIYTGCHLQIKREGRLRSVNIKLQRAHACIFCSLQAC